MTICIVDTSILVELLNVHGVATRHVETLEQYRERSGARQLFLLPVPVLLETGNHVAGVPDGRLRRAAAERFIELATLALDGGSPFVPTHAPHPEEIRAWLPRWQDDAMRRVSLVDRTLIDLWTVKTEDPPAAPDLHLVVGPAPPWLRRGRPVAGLLSRAAGARRQSEPTSEAVPEIIGRAPAVGDRVMVGGLGLQGVVTALHDSTAELDVRGKRMRANVRDVRVVGGPVPVAQVSVRVDLQPRESVAADLNVIGCTVDEALTRTERFLDESMLTDQRVVRVIHGYGTGQLKRALATFLQQHPLVAGFQAAPPEHGGGGVTVVELKD